MRSDAPRGYNDENIMLVPHAEHLSLDPVLGGNRRGRMQATKEVERAT
jgi:hypothetical protein